MANNTPRGWNPLIGVGFTALGIGYLYEAFRKDVPATPVGRAPFKGQMLGRAGLPEQQASGGVTGGPMVVKDGIRSIKFYPAGNIDNRVRFIVEQIRKDSEDKKTVTEARAIVSGKCRMERGGVNWCVPPKDWLGELRMLYWALTNPNSPYAMRYTRDHATVDMFGSSESHRRLPSGDCDDFAIRLGALARAIGYPVKCRIVAPAGAPGQWAHIYLMVGNVPGEGRPSKWLPMDPTEPQHGPFWEVSRRLVSSVKDYEV